MNLDKVTTNSDPKKHKDCSINSKSHFSSEVQNMKDLQKQPIDGYDKFTIYEFRCVLNPS